MKDNFIGNLYMTVMALFLTGLAMYGCQGMTVSRRCKEYGWRGSSVTYNFQGYCEHRVGQTDVIVPLEKATGGPPKEAP